MSDPARRFHETWLGMVQPSEGLVVSVPVLVEAQCMEKQDRKVQEALIACTAKDAEGAHYVPDVAQLLSDVLGLSDDLFDDRDALPKPLRLYVPEGKQEIRPTLALKKRGPSHGGSSGPSHGGSSGPSHGGEAGQGEASQGDPSKKGETAKKGADLPAAAEAGRAYAALVWDVPTEVDLDKPETLTGPWEYPAQAKFDRLLRECRVPIGILTNGRELRLTYAPTANRAAG